MRIFNRHRSNSLNHGYVMAALLPLLLSFAVSQGLAQERQEKNLNALSAKDEAFLRKNKGQTGITEMPSGLQWKVVKTGTGPKPMKFSRVSINYTIKDLEGKIIASNGNRVWSHRMDKALVGMEEALKMMNVGSKWMLYMPPRLCSSKYEKIGRNRVLQCDIELLAVN